MRELNLTFQKLVQKIPKDFRPQGNVILLYYVNDFEENIGFLLRDEAPKDFKEAAEMVRKIEDKVASFGKVDLFDSFKASTSKLEAKPRAMHSNHPATDMMTKLVEGTEKMTTYIHTMSNRMVKWERA